MTDQVPWSELAMSLAQENEKLARQNRALRTVLRRRRPRPAPRRGDALMELVSWWLGEYIEGRLPPERSAWARSYLAQAFAAGYHWRGLDEHPEKAPPPS